LIVHLTWPRPPGGSVLRSWPSAGARACKQVVVAVVSYPMLHFTARLMLFDLCGVAGLRRDGSQSCRRCSDDGGDGGASAIDFMEGAGDGRYGLTINRY
jgi:hypothetical protein